MSSATDGHEHGDSGAGALWDVLDGLFLAAVVLLACLGAEWLVRQLAASRVAARVAVPDDLSTLDEASKA